MAEYINKSDVSGLVRMGWSGDAIVTAIINDGISSVPAIPIPDGATNGDMIKAMFPNAKVRTSYYTYFVEVKLEYHSQYDAGLLFDKKWWDAPYKGEYNLSEKPTGSESEDE